MSEGELFEEMKTDDDGENDGLRGQVLPLGVDPQEVNGGKPEMGVRDTTSASWKLPDTQGYCEREVKAISSG